MEGCTSQLDNRASFRVPCLFSFHQDDEVLKGVNIGLGGFALCFPATNDGTFQFYRGQILKNCHIQVEGETIYFSKLAVSWLDLVEGGVMYGFRIISIVEPEKAKYEAIYHKVLDQYRHKSNLSISQKQALENFFV